MSAGFDLYTVRTDFLTESSFINQSTGIGLRLGFPISERAGLGLTYSLIEDKTQIAHVLVDHDLNASTPQVDQCDPVNPGRPLICDQAGSFLTSVFGYSFNVDHRNDPVTPTRGFDFSLSQDIAGIGGEVNYLRTEFSAGLYYGIVQNVTLNLRATGGFITGWGGDDVRINDRFFRGGATFRGFDVAGLGPRQLIRDDATGAIITKGDAIGGNLYSVNTIELDFPFGLPESYGINGGLFAEFGTLGVVDAASRQNVEIPGTATHLAVSDDTSLRASVGLSVFWDSPFGPVQFDFAEPLAYEDYDRRQNFRFSTRTRF